MRIRLLFLHICCEGPPFAFRGVEFKVIAAEPSTVPVARVGPDTIVHFEGESYYASGIRHTRPSPMLCAILACSLLVFLIAYCIQRKLCCGTCTCAPGSLNPSLIDILPPEILLRVRRLPARVQPFAIIAAAQVGQEQMLTEGIAPGRSSAFLSTCTDKT